MQGGTSNFHVGLAARQGARGASRHLAAGWTWLALGAALGCLPERELSSYLGGAGAGSGPGIVSATEENRTDSGAPGTPAVVDVLVSVTDAGVAVEVPVDAMAPSTLVCREECSCERREDRDFMFCPTIVSFELASERCAEAGGTLVSVDDAEQNEWLTERMQSAAVDDFWLSGTDTEVEGVWRWFDGRIFFEAGADAAAFYAPWDEEQPNDVNGEDCMRSIAGSWRDLDCADEIAYACQG